MECCLLNLQIGKKAEIFNNYLHSHLYSHLLVIKNMQNIYILEYIYIYIYITIFLLQIIY